MTEEGWHQQARHSRPQLATWGQCQRLHRQRHLPGRALYDGVANGG